ncbi:MAG: hypothetical protein QG656_2519, partial [Candidatus Hydrogenedentes bacterium]|nr:hypothetical protein [Candidatus Hydrogenedentota bacterium]
GFLAVNSIGQDPFIVTNTVPEISGNLTARFRMKSASGGIGQFFWTTRDAPNFGPKQRLDFAPIHDGQWHEYEIAFVPATTLTGLRLDPSAAPGTIQLEWLRISQEGAVVKEWSFQ